MPPCSGVTAQASRPLRPDLPDEGDLPYRRPRYPDFDVPPGPPDPDVPPGPPDADPWPPIPDDDPPRRGRPDNNRHIV
jgi:hypothetical protein